MRKEDILAGCIDEILAGMATVEDCLARHPRVGGELRPLLRIAASIKSATENGTKIILALCD